MAQIPTPRSYSEILGDMIDAFLSRYGLRALKIGSPVLSMLESTAQSQLRSSEDIFTLLEASTLDQAKGTALDRIGADETLPRETENPASGVVSISDTSFTKKSSKIFQGTPAPIVGSIHVNVVDASLFPVSGSVYLGRGTSNYEGPLAYTSILPPGSGFGQSGGNYWTLVFSTGTLKFHNLGEAVVVAQGGNRFVGAGTIVQTPQGNVVNASQFKTLYSATIPDGEIIIDGVAVIALSPGTIGNISAGAINGFVAGSAPFTGAAVTNPAPFTNGQASENDDTYRERIRQARQSRTRGTALALTTFATGVTAADENKRVLSASVVTQGNTVLYIDDGTGYEEKSEGIAIESFIDLATGGETFFKTSAPRPVSKAFLLSTEVAPFTLGPGMQLAFNVGGVVTVHTFDTDEFRSITNATAYEVVASINANPALNFSARTYAQATQVAVFAKTNTNESIQNVATENDANEFLGFPSGRVDTMRLYKNDRLLSKDGVVAAVVSNASSVWGALGPTEDLQISVDGTPLTNLAGGTYTFTAQDFINANTGYTSVGRNSPVAWAAVFNLRIAGITAAVSNGLITLTSNKGLSSKASIVISGGSLVTNGMFSPPAGQITLSSAGANSDYTLNRNTGEIKLSAPLAVADRLDAGSVNTRAFLQSPSFTTIAVSAAQAHLWFAVDGSATIVPTGLTASTPVNFTSSATAWGRRWRVAQNTGTGMFTNVLVGDWAVFWDLATPSAFIYKSYRVTTIDTVNGTYFEFESTLTPSISNPITFANSGLSIARTSASLQEVVLPVNPLYTAGSIQPFLTISGADATVYRTTSLRLNTSTFGDGQGDIALVAADVDGQKLGLPIAAATVNIAGHLASVESGDPELGTPDFRLNIVSNSGVVQPQVKWSSDPLDTIIDVSAKLVGLGPYPDTRTLAGTRYGQNTALNSAIATATGSVSPFTLTLRQNAGEWMLRDRVYFPSTYRLASDDSLTVLVDGDAESKRFIVPMWRTLKTVGTTYGATNTFKDGDNGGQTLAAGFGYGAAGFDFNDFAVFMAARVKTHDIGDAVHYTVPPSNLNSAVLWRYFRLGPDGNLARVTYTLPAGPAQAVSITTDAYTSQFTDVRLVLGSGVLRTGYSLTTTHNIGVVVTASASGVSNVSYVLGFPSTSATRDGSGNVTITLNVASAGATNHGFVATNSIFAKNNNATFPDGYYAITSVSPTTITYNDGGIAAGPTGITGSVSYGSTEATLTGSPVAAGDFFRIETSSGLATAFKGTTMRIDTLPNAQTIKGVLPATISVNTVTTWAPLGDPTAFKAFINLGQTATAIVSAINATSLPVVKGTVIGNGLGIIDKASYAEAGSTTTQWFNCADGINYVQTTTIPGTSIGDYQFLFKLPTTSTLATNSDWPNEVVKIVPRTAKNVSDWLNAPTVSGLFTACDVERSTRAAKVQIASLTPGSAGSVQIQGGTSNNVTAAVRGSATLVASNYIVATILATDAAGMQAGSWVSLDNGEVLPKNVFGPATNLLTISASAGNFKFTFLNDGAAPTVTTNNTLWTKSSPGGTSALVRVERQGNYFLITNTGLGADLDTTTVTEGDWVRIKTPVTNTYFGQSGSEAVSLINPGNTGIFRVVRVIRYNNATVTPSGQYLNAAVWLENSAGEEQVLAECDIQFFTYDSVMPGDQLRISTTLWDGTGGSNQGVFTVATVGDNGGGAFTNRYVMVLSGALQLVTVDPGVLGAIQYRQVQMLEGTPTHLIKKIINIAPNQTDSTLYDVKFSTPAGYARIGSTPGTIITLLDKLAYPLTIAKGIDGYQHSTGLIAEVNRVIYGDPSDTATYPGVAAAGSNVDIQGPLVKRTQVTLSLRLRSGAPQQDIEDRVKSAVASVINKTAIGTSIALSDLTNAATKVAGVVSAVMVSPAATAGNDLITVQPYEKPLVLSVDNDVFVSFAGE